MQCRIGELIGKQAKARDIRRPAPAFAALGLRGKTVERDFQRIPWFCALNPNWAGHRIDLTKIKPCHIRHCGRRAKLARRTVVAVKLDRLAGLYPFDRGK